MRCHLEVKLITENDYVVKLIRDGLLPRISGVPNASFPQKVKAGPLDNTCSVGTSLGSEEHGRTEDPFEGGH